MQLKRMIRGVVAAGAAAALLSVSSVASAFTSVEGQLIGDQNFYWTTPGQVWIFPHTLGNIDNRVMLQWGGGPAGDGAPMFNALPIQNADGVGLVLEVADNFNLGLWASRFVQPELAGFVNNGVAASMQGPPTGPLALLDANNGSTSAGRKLDLFASYALPDLGVEAGLHIWWGSGSRSVIFDDSVGPINIDTDRDPDTGDDDGFEESLGANGNNKFGLSDLGIGLGAAYTGVPGLRADLGFDLNILSATWEQAALSYADIGGTGIGINARAHYQLTDKFTLGGFVRFARQGLHYTPERNADGTNLADFFIPDDDLTATPNPFPSNPQVGDPANPTPLDGNTLASTTFSQIGQNLQISLLAAYQPVSRVKLYGALGFDRRSTKQMLVIGNEQWLAEDQTALTSLPFINMGFEGKVFDFLDIFMGAAKRWTVTTSTQRGLDTRIPNNDRYVGDVADPATPGTANATNARRREVIEETSVNSSTTQFMLGTRIHYGPVQLVGQVDPGFLLRNVNFISGAQGNTWFWTSLIYDWDYDSDVTGGNGTILGGKQSPHEPAPAPAPAPAIESEG